LSRTQQIIALADETKSPLSKDVVGGKRRGGRRSQVMI
jgi:hypothetical protein